MPDHPSLEYARTLTRLAWERKLSPARDPWIALLASAAWPDLDWLEDFVDKLAAKYPRATIVHTGKRDAGKVLVERAEMQGLRLIEVKPDPWAGTTYKPGIRSSHVCALADIIMVFHAGTADTAKTVIEKALNCHRPEARFYPGLHVYEAKRSRKTKSGGGKLTGDIQHKVRHSFDLVTTTQAEARIKTKGRL